MAEIYERRESRDIRPFFAIDGLVHLLQNSEIRCFDDEKFTGEETFWIDRDRLPDVRVSVRPKIDSTAYLSVFSEDALSCAVIVSNTVSKNAWVKRLGLEQLADVVVPAEVFPALVAGTKWIVEVVVFLRKSLDRTAGMPYLPGHCISRKRFSLQLATDNSLFDIRIRDDEEWRKAGLPEKTLYQIDGASGMNSSSDGAALTLWLHKIVYDKMQRSARNAAVFTRLLVPEMLCSALTASFTEWRDAEFPEPQSPLEAFIGRFEKQHKMSFSDIKRIFASGDVSRIRALLQSDFGAVEVFEESR